MIGFENSTSEMNCSDQLICSAFDLQRVLRELHPEAVIEKCDNSYSLTFCPSGKHKLKCRVNVLQDVLRVVKNTACRLGGGSLNILSIHPVHAVRRETSKHECVKVEFVLPYSKAECADSSECFTVKGW